MAEGLGALERLASTSETLLWTLAWQATPFLSADAAFSSNSPSASPL